MNVGGQRMVLSDLVTVARITRSQSADGISTKYHTGILKLAYAVRCIFLLYAKIKCTSAHLRLNIVWHINTLPVHKMRVF